MWIDHDAGRRTPILLHGAEWSWNPRDELTVDATPLASRAWAFIQRCGLDPDAVRYRARERRLDEGALIHVIGYLEPVAQIVPLLGEIAESQLAQVVANLDRAKRPPGSAPLTAVDFAAALRSRFGPDEQVLWSSRSGLFITPGDRSSLAGRLLWVVVACRLGASASFVSALAVFQLAVAAW